MQFGQTVAGNVLRLGEGGVLEAPMLDLAQMFNRGTNVQSSTEAPLSPNRC